MDFRVKLRFGEIIAVQLSKQHLYFKLDELCPNCGKVPAWIYSEAHRMAVLSCETCKRHLTLRTRGVSLFEGTYDLDGVYPDDRGLITDRFLDRSEELGMDPLIATLVASELHEVMRALLLDEPFNPTYWRILSEG